MNNIFFNLILPLIIIAIFLGVLIYQIFFNKRANKRNDNSQKQCVSYNAHVRNSSPTADKIFQILESNNIEPQFLNHEVGDKGD